MVSYEIRKCRGVGAWGRGEEGGQGWFSRRERSTSEFRILNVNETDKAEGV